MKNRSHFAIILAILLICAQTAFYLAAWFRLLDDPSLRGMDFVSVYALGRIARQGQYQVLFNIDSQRAEQHELVAPNTFSGDLSPSQHPPYLAPLLALLAVDDFVTAYILWSVLRLAVMAACAELIRRFLRRAGWEPVSALLGALGALSFYPIFIGLLGGQDTAFTLIGLLLWMIGLLKRKEAQAGIGLALASLSPLIAGALGLPLLAARRKAGGWFVAAMLGLGLYTLALVGAAGIRDLIALMGISAQGEGFTINQERMSNLLGLLLRHLPALEASTARLVAWGAFLLVIILLVIFWWNKRQTLRPEHIGIAVILSLLTAPHVHYHALSSLLLPLLGCTVILHEQGRKELAILLIPTISMLLLISALANSTVNFVVQYVLMLGLAIGLGCHLWIQLRQQKTAGRDAISPDHNPM